MASERTKRSANERERERERIQTETKQREGADGKKEWAQRDLLLGLLFLIKLSLLLNGGVLVLLVLRDQIVHVGLRLRELHLVHALAGVPMQEGLAAEHRRELLGHPLEHLLDRRVVANERRGHLQPLGRDIADAALYVVRDPLHEVAAVLVLHVEHLLVDLLRGHPPAEHRRGGQVAPVAGVRRGHHVLGVEHLLRQLGHRQGAVLLRATRGQRGEPHQEEVQTGERDQVDRQLAQVGVQLTREPQAARHTAHHRGHQVVQVPKRRRGQLQRAEADVVQRLVVNAHHLIRVLDQLVDAEGGVVGLHHGVRDLRRGDHGERQHHPVGVLLADLRDQQRAHPAARAPAQTVRNLEALQAVAALGLLANHVQHGVDQLGALRVVPLGPVVARPGLPKHEVVRAEDLPVRARPHRVHRAGLQVHQDGTGHVASPGGLVEVHVDALQLQVGVPLVGPRGVHAVLIGDHFPELGTDLVPALPSLNVDNLAHFGVG
eukprot:RCo053036